MSINVRKAKNTTLWWMDNELIAGITDSEGEHSYRYAWAERAKTAGMPERFAQEALGHNSKAVHRSYAKWAKVIVPALEEYESNGPDQKVIALRLPQPGKMAAELPG